MNLIEITVYILILILGLVIGSFLNVCIYRIPKHISVSKGRSMCPVCGYTIKFYDNIPLVSYILLGGRCRRCKCRIPLRYPLVEAVTGIAFLLCAKGAEIAEFDLSLPMLWIFSACLICVAFIDWDTQEIPDRFNVIILALGAISFLLPGGPLWYERLIGLVCVSVPMFVIALLTGGFGMGDVKLMAAVGLLLGWKNTVLAGLLGAVAAAVVSVLLISLKKKTRKDKIPFGPYLALASFIAHLYGEAIIAAYLGLF